MSDKPHDHSALVELTIRYGAFREVSKTLAINISADLTRELLDGVELSDDPFSLLLASPNAFGGRSDALTMRRRAFQMRRSVAEEIAAAMVPAMLAAFGVNDKFDGYRVDELSDEERALHKARRRL